MGDWKRREDLQEKQDYEFFKLANPRYFELKQLLDHATEEPHSEIFLPDRNDFINTGIIRSPAENPEDTLYRKQLGLILSRALNNTGLFKEYEKKVLTEYFFEGRSLADIAREMSILENTAKTYLFQAIRKLRESEYFNGLISKSARRGKIE